ncbi:hypothetical protein IIC68_03455 [archaeon]|nr:hypothetical protein [archaeon]
MVKKILLMGIIAVLLISMASTVMAATGTIKIKDSNGGNIKLITIDSNYIVCNPEEAIEFRYCPPQLEENDPAIDRTILIGTGHVDHGKG